MIRTDAVVIGAGPVGLFQVFQLGLLGLSAELIDVLPEAGGQCVALYPDKPIYDIPGVPRCTGRELTQLLLAQCQPFLPPDHGTGRPRNLHLGQQVTHLEVDRSQPEAPIFQLHTSTGEHFEARAVFIAAGAGAFVPRSLPIPGLDKDAQPVNLHYHLPADGLPAPWAGQHLVVAGGGDEALQSVLDVLAAPPEQRPIRLSLLHRRDQFQADAELDRQVRACIAQGQIDLVLGMPQGADLSDTQRLSCLHLLGADGQARTLPLDHLLVRQGLSPKLGPLSNWGLALERKQIAVDTVAYASSIPGIHAVGDINTYPGKKRLLLCGFHEATMAAHAAATRLRPLDPPQLLYTTTSHVLHQRLGITQG
ncbi:MAG TPA: NAD(P)/FAD-dependent oxidoreductase [Aquabacterium sp.]|uniref:NAD(P)/FAD-dependent oxidoreductase n=1 Tax=Aquabacterium sp. TaxID=1872578 RepID=UPI002E33E073|nr:NAD(P)/FAD-dependent oxidoreductase [Aquabacterium sp.]HEX5372890.1 NAD(P)/FAD-dependent oxidoreductase [Aquabacterium sp.]